MDQAQYREQQIDRKLAAIQQQVRKLENIVAEQERQAKVVHTKDHILAVEGRLKL